MSGTMLEVVKENFSKEINKIAIEVCFMLMNMVSDNCDVAMKIISQNLFGDLLEIDCFFQTYEVKFLF